MEEFLPQLSPLIAKVFLRARSVGKTLGLWHVGTPGNYALSRNMNSKELQGGVLRGVVTVRLAADE